MEYDGDIYKLGLPDETYFKCRCGSEEFIESTITYLPGISTKRLQYLAYICVNCVQIHVDAKEPLVLGGRGTSNEPT